MKSSSLFLSRAICHAVHILWPICCLLQILNSPACAFAFLIWCFSLSVSFVNPNRHSTKQLYKKTVTGKCNMWYFSFSTLAVQSKVLFLLCRWKDIWFLFYRKTKKCKMFQLKRTACEKDVATSYYNWQNTAVFFFLLLSTNFYCYCWSIKCRIL